MKKTKIEDLHNPEGTILGMSENQAITTDEHVIAFGSSGTGKSYKFVQPNAVKDIENGNSVVITNPSPELQEIIIPLAKEKGYDVKILNLRDPRESDKWNPLEYVNEGEEEDVLRKTAKLTHILFSASGDKNDAFFDQAEENLLKALILYVSSADYKGEKTLSSVYDLLL